MALSFSAECAAAMLLGLKNHIENGSGKIVLKIFGGTMPANATTALSSNTVLAVLQMDPPFAGTPANKTLTANQFTADSSAAAAGTATFFRLYRENNDTAILQGSTSLSGGDGDLKLNQLEITQGEAVRIAEAKFVLP